MGESSQASQSRMKDIFIHHLLPLYLTAVTSASIDPTNDQCIMYDTCGWNPDCEDEVGCNESQFLNCRYDGAPKPANYEALELLQSECPHLYDELTATGEVNLLLQPKAAERFANQLSNGQCLPRCHLSYVLLQLPQELLRHDLLPKTGVLCRSQQLR